MLSLNIALKSSDMSSQDLNEKWDLTTLSTHKISARETPDFTIKEETVDVEGSDVTDPFCVVADVVPC